ncbi:MAG: putative sugar nucleotidyl transferase [candidate division Zixibacteria bacterium]|nr:putative sugar nucleotidyl transferase [candidate division Zixibacteria bacterium]
MNRLIIFEDGKYADFCPLTLSRAVFELRCGSWTLGERIARAFPGYDVSFSCREELTGIVGLRAGGKVNRIDYQPGDRLVFVNGRLKLGEKLTRELQTITVNRIYTQGPVTAAVVITQPLKSIPSDLAKPAGIATPKTLGIEAEIADGEFEFFDYLWNLVDQNGNQIGLDFEMLVKGTNFGRMATDARIDNSAVILTQDNFYIAAGADIGPGAVIDCRHGAVIVDKEAVIGPLSYIEGPCYIGPGTRIFRGNIREGCSFGPDCRVGGEVEESIFQGYTNKYHDGFLGHAYLGSWVNLGALTNNSDLKNTYQSITVSVCGRKIDTGLTKVGSFIGDHSKTGIGTLLNTGVAIGFSCNIFGGKLVTSREVSSFSWGDESGYDIYKLEKAMEVAKIVMNRRNVPFTSFDEDLFKSIYEQTTAGR